MQEINKGEEENDISFLYEYKIRINPEVHNSLLMTYGRISEPTISSKIIFIGDPAQLPPIGMNFSPALELNLAIRKDKFGIDLPIQPSDTVIIGSNNYRLDIMNGEFAIVSESSQSVESREVCFYSKEYINCILLKYGYAVTCHKAQGGEWENTFVFWDIGVQTNFNYYESEHNRSGKTNSDFYRWAYTAVTRASKNLFCINPPYFSSFSDMNFIDVNVQQALSEFSGQSNHLKIININEVIPELEKLGLTNEPLAIQDHFIYRWYNLRKFHIDIAAWQRIEYEVRYIFKREAQKASFKYWLNRQNVFNSNYQKLSAQTNSDELFEEITKILDNSIPIEVDRNNTGVIIPHIEFDVEIEKEKPFLKILFDFIIKELSNGEVISDIKHLEYRERYTFEKNGKSSIVDFEYNKAEFFGRLLPIEKECECHGLLVKIKHIVSNLKKADYVS